MEILQKFKQNGYFTADLYHLLTKKRIVETSEEIIPSEYIKEMKMTTAERLQNLNNININNLVKSKNKDSVPVLAFTPQLLVFQNFKPNDKIVAKFSVKNISSAPSFLNMVFKESSYFFIKPSVGQLLSRLAPGISVTFNVTFQPPNYVDYTHKVSFLTDVDQYVLPLIAMGPRPIFDFPDQITIPRTPLKVDNSVVLNLHNVGVTPAGFTLVSKTPFSVHPKSSYTSPQENINIQVGFKTMTLGTTMGTITAIFETGEIFRIKVTGTTHVVNVELEKQTIRFLDTFNTMSRQQTLKIHNNSPHLLTYMCMKNSCVFDDFEEKLKLATIFYDYKASASQKYRKLVHYDVASSDEHDRVYTRIFFDELQSLVVDETLQFQNAHFSITPVKGNIWPNRTTEITITFSPQEIGEFETVAYLDIDGISDRTPLNMVGTSLPPQIYLNVETLDMENVFINKIYNYEIVAMNKGQINGEIVYKEIPTLFGSHITCTPKQQCLPPGEKKIFVISFSNSNQGPYFEEIHFTIRNANVLLKLYLKGEVIYPSLLFSIPCLDYGNVSVGEPKTLELEVINESIVDVNAFLKVSSDAPEVSAITLEDYAVANPKPKIPEWPREFNIMPAKIHLEPESRVSLQVTLIANLVRANQTYLELELEKSDSPPITLPIVFNAKVPEISTPPDIKLRACFLNSVYETEIRMKANEYHGYFTIHEEVDEHDAIHVDFGITEGMITPNSTIVIPVFVKISMLGVQEYLVKILLFGVSTPMEICRITGCGVRPMVTITPTSLHWGQVKVLTNTQKTLVLFNDSPVRVSFKTYMLSKDSKWQILPEEGFIEPESELEVTVSLYLVDVNTYTNKAIVQMENVKDIVVPVTATGVGTSIVVGELKDRIELGLHYTKIPINVKIPMVNMGTRLHCLEWHETYKTPKNKAVPTSFFDLYPRSFKMSAGEKLDLTVSGFSNKVASIMETWYLVGSIEGINKKELLLNCDISAVFVDPKIELSHNQLDFQYDFGPYSEYYKLTDIITLKNVSKLPLDVEISVKSPFAIIQKQNTYKILPEEENLCCCIYYNESDLNVQNMNKELGHEQSRSFVDCLTLKRVEPIRTGSLDFFQDIHKIKAAFNLTYTVEECMEDQDIMKLQILFDTTKHTSLKSKIYGEILRIRFKGHRNKDALKMTGSINFPNIIILTPKIDFRCILNGTVDSKTIKIQNVTPLMACYRLQWRKSWITTMPSVTPKYQNLSLMDYKSFSVEESVHSTSELSPRLLSTSVAEKADAVSKDHESVSQANNSKLAVESTPLMMSGEDLGSTRLQSTQYAKLNLLRKILPMLDVTYESVFSWKYKFPKSSESNRINVNDVFELTPHRGLLKPGEVQYVHVMFKPRNNICVRAILDCEVLGGPTESVLITGQSSDLLYKISTVKLNFKIRSFHENATELILLTNISRYTFQYKTYLNEPKFETYLDGTILNIDPAENILEPDQEGKLSVVVRPGVVGYFNRSFLLEIGHLPHIHIQVFGWGVIPQVYITLPRPNLLMMAPDLGYLAIPSLTPEYLAAVNEYFIDARNATISYDFSILEKCYEDPDLSEWYICNPDDTYPSVIDIELAIERMLVIKYIRARPEILQNYLAASKSGAIPGFITTPYVVDFGVVITGSTVQCCADIINYGPIVTKLSLAKGFHLPTWLGLKLCAKLNPGETGKMEITFSPNSQDFTDLEQNIETSFNLEVPYGITIPIQMKALCAVPYLMSNVSRIDFGSVRCGNKIICSIPLKNIGKPTCIWYVTLRLKAAGPNPMQVLHSSGKFEPGEGGWLSVSFKPTMEMIYEGMLVFRFHMNPNRMTIPVIGQGIVPHVHIIGDNVSFSPTLPWAETTEMYFGITNPCPFPVELIFAHSDDKWKEEEEIYELLNKYYDKPEELLVPLIEPGTVFPPAITNFYKGFKETVQKTLYDEALQSAKSAKTTKTTTPSAKSKGKLSPKAAKKKEEHSQHAYPVIQKKSRTETEIIADALQKLKDSNVDPLKNCMNLFEPSSNEEAADNRLVRGIIIFVYGTPMEDCQCQEMAYSIGKKLNIPTVNIDQCMVEALCTSSSPARDSIMAALEEMYHIYQKYNVSDDAEEEPAGDENKDPYDLVKMKLEVLANSKNIGAPKGGKGIVDKKKKKSPSASQASQSVLAAIGSTTMFHTDLLFEVLCEYLSRPKFERGFVVDTLNSIIFKVPSITMTYVLKSRGDIRNVHFVLCYSDFNKWVHAYEEAQKDAETVEPSVKVYDENEMKAIVESVEEMTEEEYENASPEIKAVYVEHGLAKRRQKYLEKYGKKETTKKPEHHRSTTPVTDTTKKDKKEKAVSKTAEYTPVNSKYNDFAKNIYDSLINIANNWVFEARDLGVPLVGFTGQPLTSMPKKQKRKSEAHLNITAGTSTPFLGERGFPITYIMCPCLHYKTALINMLLTSPETQNALKEEEKEDLLQKPMIRQEFSVLLPNTFPALLFEESLQWRYLEENTIKKCECNQITDLNLLDDSTQDNVLNILSKWHCTCGKRVASSQTSTSEIPASSEYRISQSMDEGSDSALYPLPLRSVRSICATDRIILGPGDLVRCKYTFDPKYEGHFKEKRYVEVRGWPESRVSVNASAICDLPRLDNRPKKMFASFLRRTVPDVIYKMTFLDDQKVFEFGPIFVGSQRIYEETYSIDLRNSSLMTAEVEIEFLEDTRVFNINQTSMTLEPGARGKITISAAPDDTGVHKTVLLLCVKDNPEIVTINISCKGVVPNVEILPQSKIIDYGKLLLYRRENDRFIVKNDSILPIMWKIRNPADFKEDFIISSNTGIVPRQDNQVIPVTYIACTVGVISQRALYIDIYDAEGRGYPMLVDTLHLSAECYDVLLDCAYENPAESFLNYGNVKVNSRVTREMYMLNRGKYNIYFKFKKVKNFPEPSLLKSFELSRDHGVVPANVKLVTVEFSCTPTTSINLSNVPAFICSLLDDSKNQVVVAKFPVCISIASFYNTFTLFPLGELNFHIIPIGSGVIRDVILNNTSKCPFTYEIVLPPEYQLDHESHFSMKHKEHAKVKLPPMRCGNFLIMNEDNLLAPGTSRTIQIQFSATAVRTFEETINFIISDTCPAEALGVPLRLIGTGALPTLDFWNIYTTFREHLIVKNLSEYKVPESSPHCVFVEDSVSLHFFSVTINSSFTGMIDLYNNGLVPSALTMKLHYQSNSNDSIFSLDKYKTHIEPLVHKNLGIIFTPKALEEYRAVLEIKLKLLDNQEKSFKICLIGEGVIPRINLETPPLAQNRTAWLRFPVTCLGSISSRPIRFTNISSTKSLVVAKISEPTSRDRPTFWIAIAPDTEHLVVFNDCDDKDTYSFEIRLLLLPDVTANLLVNFNPLKKGRSNCDVYLTIVDNPYEMFNVVCDAEAFSEEVILLDLEMLPMDMDTESFKTGSTTDNTQITEGSRKKAGSAKKTKDPKKKRISKHSIKTTEEESSLMKYLLDFGGCELGRIQKRTVVMVNHSEKVYKFLWSGAECITVKPSMGYIAPAEEKDLEILFFSAQPVNIQKESFACTLTAVSDDILVTDAMGVTWDNRQLVTIFDRNKDSSLNERYHTLTQEKVIPQSENLSHVINMIIIYSAVTEYTKYQCTLKEKLKLKDTFIYQNRKNEFTIENMGNIPIKIKWDFEIDENFPARIDNPQILMKEETSKMILEEETLMEEGSTVYEDLSAVTVEEKKDDAAEPVESSRITLFSGKEQDDRQSVDTWFEIDLPFQIEPVKDCIAPNEKRTFTITFAPLEAFFYKVKLKSTIDNLDPYDQNVTCNIMARSLVPYCHLDIEESDYISGNRRKCTGKALLPNLTILEFNVLGSGCYKKTFNVVNPTMEAYEFNFEMTITDNADLVPVHCNSLKGFVEGGTSTEVTFTFSPTAPGVYESLWKFMIPVHNLVMNLLVVGIVREPNVVFIPTILVISNSLVGFTTTNTVMIKNSENENLKFEFNGNSMNNESGKTAVVLEPECGVLKARSETPLKIIYTPLQDGPLSFKIFFKVTYLTKPLTLCVNALSYSIRPKVTYKIIGIEHVLNSDVCTNIYLEQTVSTYSRTIPFTIKNDGSATFLYDWHYNTDAVKKYLNVEIEPKSGYLSPGAEVQCILMFTLKQVMVRSFPVTLFISDGPEYSIMLNADIEKPLYYFSCKNIDFGKCIVNAPDDTYSKTILFINTDKSPLIINLKNMNVPELIVDCPKKYSLEPNKKMKITIFFRPKQVKEYDFKLQFWVNSLCEEIVVVKGEGVPLLYDLYEGCQKSFDLGAVRVGEKIVRQIEVMNHSKVPIAATFVFRDMYPRVAEAAESEGTSMCLSPTEEPSGSPHLGLEAQSRVKMLQAFKDGKIKDQTYQDIINTLSSLKVIPNKCVIKPFRKVPIKIQFKPVGLISKLEAQLNMRVFQMERPLVKLRGSATGMHLCFSQNSLQFGRVRKRGCKILKVMLLNKGDFGARFWWQPLVSSEFVISPMRGNVPARKNVTFTITCRPQNHNPFIKVWANCNIENYKPLELALYASCLDIGNLQNKTITMQCPVREVLTEYVIVTNPTDDLWLVLSDMSGGPFETLKEFNIEPNSTFEIPVYFKPKSMGKHETQVLFSPLGESALFITLVGTAVQPNPNADIQFAVSAKEPHTEELTVYNITEFPESYFVSTEIVKVIPEKFDGFYEMKHPETVKTWGEVAARCRWTFWCYAECEMHMKVMFINEETREYQYYNIKVTVVSSQIVETLSFVTRARESLQKDLVVANPLSSDAEFSIKCNSLQVPETLWINKNSEATFTMTYSPLVVGDSEDILEVTNRLVGTYTYKVILKCTPPKKKNLEFTTPLGTCIPIRLRVPNKTDYKTEFECTVDHPSIIANKDYLLGPNEKGKFLVHFEPTELEEQNITVSFKSPVAGEFVFSIKGIATAPKPLGPYVVRAGSSTVIRFKNIFNEDRTFRVNIDREEFSVNVAFEVIKAKKDLKVTVSLSELWPANSPEPPTGCLTIETAAEPEQPRVVWTYFLQGIE